MAASPRDIRRLALLALYQLDAQCRDERGREHNPSDDDLEMVRAALDSVDSLADEGLAFADLDLASTDFQAKDKDRALAKAADAHGHRAEADAATEKLAPDWPARRQAAVDRAILRLAHHELVRTDTAPNAIINEAVELAKAFSGEKSPGFINALLDKMAKDAKGAEKK